jgi:hypothetical protein
MPAVQAPRKPCSKLPLLAPRNASGHGMPEVPESLSTQGTGERLRREQRGPRCRGTGALLGGIKHHLPAEFTGFQFPHGPKETGRGDRNLYLPAGRPVGHPPLAPLTTRPQSLAPPIAPRRLRHLPRRTIRRVLLVCQEGQGVLWLDCSRSRISWFRRRASSSWSSRITILQADSTEVPWLTSSRARVAIRSW